MGFHQKAASCSAIPSFNSFSSISTTTTTPPSSVKHKSTVPSASFSSSSTASKQTVAPPDQLQLFPLPSFCLYSKKALVNEYAPESEIVQFLAPSSAVLQERLPMFVGVLQSLFTVVNDMPFVDKEQEEEEATVVEEDEYTDIEEDDDDDDDNENDSLSPFTIIGLNSMKLVIGNNMYDHVTDSTIYKKDLCLVIFVSAHLTDAAILQNMTLLRDSLVNEISFNVTANQLGDQLIPLVKYWFEEGH